MTVRKKRLIIISAAVLAAAAIAAAVILLCALEDNKASVQAADIVATVDGEPIVFAELCLAAGDIRSEVVTYFYNTYKAELTEDFWTESYNGEVPNERFYSLSLEAAVRIKTEQLMMREYDLTEDISYQTFYDNFITENKRRLEALRNDEIIYGPEQYTEASYFDYVHNNLLLKLKAEINKNISGSAELDYSGDNFEAEYNKKRENVTVSPITSVEKQLKSEFYKLFG